MDSSACILWPTIIHHQSHDCWRMMLVLINADAQRLPQVKNYSWGTKPQALQILAIPTSELNHYNWVRNHGVQRWWCWHSSFFTNAQLHIDLNVLVALFCIYLVLPKLLVTIRRCLHHFLINLCMTMMTSHHHDTIGCTVSIVLNHLLLLWRTKNLLNHSCPLWCD